MRAVKTLLGTAAPRPDAAEHDRPSGIRLGRAGQVLDGRYRIEERIGEGGVGLVHRAWDGHLARRVAVKILREEHCHGEVFERFLREVRVLSRLSHPNVIAFTDFGLAPPPDGAEGEATPYLVMELLEGRLLADEIDRGPLEIPRSLAIVRQILSAVGYAHEHGVVHRDLKSGNLWLTDALGRPDHVKVLDFGLARIADPQDEPGRAGFTRRGYVYGSPGYLSPEQAAGDIADERSDLYSVGVVLFEMITGQLPFDSENPNLAMQQHMLSPPPRLREVSPGLDVPEEVEQIVARALRKPRAARWQDARSFLAAVEEVGAPHGRQPSRRSGPLPLRDPGARAPAPSARAPAAQRAEPRSSVSGWWLVAAALGAVLAAAAVILGSAV